MSGTSQTSDADIVDLLRQRGSMSVSELAQATDVTSTAVRQRLSRLMDQGLVGRDSSPGGRGRPSHRYALTEKGRRQSGNNFVDLAMVLWQEIRSIPDPTVRRGLIGRMAKRMAGLYADRMQGQSVPDRMQAVAEIFGDRNVPLEIETVSVPTELPRKAAALKAAPLAAHPLTVLDFPSTPPLSQSAVLTVRVCPYPELAEVDRGICAMERMMFADLIEQDVRLTACRLDGDPCCRFQTGPLAVSNPVASG
jgi:DeoR family transcriptional regulator, suf operon transcriptional repressor